MTTIENLVVNLQARTGLFQRRMKRSQSTVLDFGRSSRIARRMVLGLGTAVLGVAGVAGVGTMIKGQLEAIDTTTKWADRLGVATDQLVGLQHAAELSGVGADQLALGMQRMTRRVAEAALGQGESVKALQELGLNAQQLARLSPDQQFRAIADAMATIPSQSDRVRLAFKLFDSEGVALVNTLRGGSEALDEQIAEAQKLGLTFDRIDAAKIEMANDAMTRMRGLVTGAARSLTIELAPFLEAATTKLVEMGTEGEGMGARVVGAFEFIGKGIAKVADLIELPKAAFFGLQSLVTTGFGFILKGIGKVGEGIDWLMEKLGVETEIGNFFETLTDGFDELADEQMAKASEALDNFVNDRAEKSVEDFFANIRKEAEETARDIASGAESMISSLTPEDLGDQLGMTMGDVERQTPAAIEIRRISQVTPAAQRENTPIAKVEKNTAESVKVEKQQTGVLRSIEAGIRELADRTVVVSI